MVTKLYAKGLKGLDFIEENLTARTVFTGRVGAGKSARGHVLWLLAAGSVPGGTVGKKGGDILTALGNGESLSVGAEIDGQTFERQLSRSKTGGVTQSLYLNGKKAAKNVFDAAIINAMQLCDVSAFLAASDTKQIEAVLTLIPGDEAGRIAELNRQEETLKLGLGNAQHTVKGLEASVASMVRGRAELPTVSATLPEVKAEVARLESELGTINEQIGEERGRIEAERKAAEEDAKRQEQASMLDMLAVPKQSETVEYTPSEYAIGTSIETATTGSTHLGFCPKCHVPGCTRERYPDGNDTCQNGHVYPSLDALKEVPTPKPTRPQAEGWHPQGFVKISDLKVALEVMDRAGCSACAAKMVLKKLMREAS